MHCIWKINDTVLFKKKFLFDGNFNEKSHVPCLHVNFFIMPVLTQRVLDHAKSHPVGLRRAQLTLQGLHNAKPHTVGNSPCQVSLCDALHSAIVTPYQFSFHLPYTILRSQRQVSRYGKSSYMRPATLHNHTR
jgi:hypothetical protein